MDYIAELAAIAKEHGGIIETKIAAQHGISKAMLYKLCKEDRIHRIVKGQYILPDDVEDELLSISKRSTQSYSLTKQLCSYMVFRTEHLLNTQSLHRPDASLLQQSKQSVKCTTSSRSCLISARPS